MTGVGEVVRRLVGRTTGRLRSLPILALSVHTACNCRCVMCDIWKANAERRELSPEQLAVHVAALRRLRVRRVMLTGGEPLLHRNLWALCELLARAGIRVTLVTTGLLVETHAAAIAQAVDTVVVSVDGPPDVHDVIRRVNGAFDRIRRGVAALREQPLTPRLIARSVVQRRNYNSIADTIAAARDAGFDEISFLAADVSSTAFNRAVPWDAARQADVAIPADALSGLAAAIAWAGDVEAGAIGGGFVVGGAASLRRILAYYAAVAGVSEFPAVRCNAPWVSAVLEADGSLRPCFFHDPYPLAENGLEGALNSPGAVAFRRALDPESNSTCRRCVCSLNLRLGDGA